MADATRMKRVLTLATAALAMAASTAAVAGDINWNGFASAYYRQALSKTIQPYGLTNTRANFTQGSLMGLNLSANVADDLNFASQLVALGSPVGNTDSFGLIAQWAFANYTPIEGMSIKAGRQLFPIFMASEYVRVGALLPFRQTPSMLLSTAPFSRFDGVSVAQSFDVGVGKLTFNAFGGVPILDTASNALYTWDFSDLLGAQMYLDGDGWRVRAQVSREFASLTSILVGGTLTAPATGKGHPQNYTLGYRFDKYNIVSWGEYAYIHTPDGTEAKGGRVFGNAHSYYLLGGYRIGKFMPRYTFSQASIGYAVFNGKATSHVFGLNYQAAPTAVVKAEYETVSVPVGGGTYLVNPATASDTSGGSFNIGVDVLF